MSDNAEAGELNEADASPLYADPKTPIVYVEAIANLAHGKHVAKFYLGRFDPSISGVGDSQFNASIQVVMPIDALANFFAFLENSIEGLISDGLIDAARLEELRKRLRSGGEE